MKFINSSPQIKQYNSSVTVNLSFESMESFLQDAENKVIAIIGEETADAIAASTDFVATLVKAAVVNFALADYSDSGALLISDSGMHVVKGDSKLPASDKKIVAFKRSCVEKAWKALEGAIYQMELHVEDWPIWYLSADRKRYLSNLLNFSNDIEEHTRMLVTPSLFQRLRSEINRCEEDSIQPLLGEAVFDSLRLRYIEHALSDLDRQLIKRIVKAVAPLSIAYSIPYLAVEIDANGVYQLSQVALSSQSDNIEQKSSPQARTLQNTMNRLITTGEAELESLRKWMNKNKSGFPGYTDNVIAPMASINDDPSSGVYFM
ncbi:MAG: hypothetical protein QHC79_09555 [Pseudosphingobacterium sp.]|nr:hypothetical protein [Pseudosphingobacterium sp.]